MLIISPKTLKLFRCAGRCEWCGQWCDRRDPHHVRPRGIGGGSRLDIRHNLCGLDRQCHNEATDGRITEADMRAIVAQREGCLQHQIEALVAMTLIISDVQ
jgi:hypothetical protein